MGNRALVVAVILSAGAAHAQFANKSVGVALGYMKLNTDQPYDWALPLSLEATLYIENGFDLTAHAQIMLVTDKISGLQSIAAGGEVGVRYFFSEEQLRPYVGLELAYLHFFDPAGNEHDYAGIGPNVGIDYFVADTVSVGARGYFHEYVMLNAAAMNGIGVSAVVATYF